MSPIRWPRADEEAAIRTMAERCGVFRPEEIDTLLEIFREACEKGFERSGYYFHVWVDSAEEREPSGLICYGRRPLTRWSWELYWLLVDPRVQRRGIGTALLQAMMEHIRQEGGRWILVETATAPAYTPARRFYERHGFRLLAQVEDFYDEGEGLAIYLRGLDPLTAASLSAVEAHAQEVE
ncbi:GNAT family N-acetyltransferase [Thermoflexus sp.]|uniref:GNAT family N-acetyltransferase n=1 Tax=Thermoflexus sp. TaxID=1969742 RepID=UPI0035E3FFDB